MKKCPFSGNDCLKKECALWVELIPVEGKEVGRCSIAWTCMVLTEVRIAIDQKKQELSPSV